MTSPIRLHIVIQHHPRRAGKIRGVIDGFRRGSYGLPVRIDVVTDTQNEGSWPTNRRCWDYPIPPGATHRLCTQDDVLPCRDFVAGAIRALQVIPDQPVNFYANRKVIEAARERGCSWARIRDGSWGQGHCLPVGLIPEALEWEQTHVNPGLDKWADTRFALWTIATGRYWWCTVPSLLEHTGAADSLIGYSNKSRVARWFIGADASALSIDWTKGMVDPPVDNSSGVASTYPHLLRKDV